MSVKLVGENRRDTGMAKQFIQGGSRRKAMTSRAEGKNREIAD